VSKGRSLSKRASTVSSVSMSPHDSPSHSPTRSSGRGREGLNLSKEAEVYIGHLKQLLGEAKDELKVRS
jgi:hypothetical protein